jgi:hypothetical protein
MKTKWLLPLLASVAVIALGDNIPNGNAPQNNNEIQSLSNEISNLRARVQMLEDRTQRLESQVEKLSHPHLAPLLSPETNRLWLNRPPADTGRGKTWGEKQVNGWTVYIVPCEQQSQ